MRRPSSAAPFPPLPSPVPLDGLLQGPAVHHRRLSLGWEQHWLFSGLAFGIVGWVVARVWVERPWRAAWWIAVLALVIAQVIEPAFEVLLYFHRVGYPNDPRRWSAFFL